MWALARRDGDLARAQRHLRAAHSMPAGARLYYQCLGSMAIGDEAGLTPILAELRDSNAASAERIDQYLASGGQQA